MTLLPFSPLFMLAAVGIAHLAPSTSAPAQPPSPSARMAIADTGWQKLVIQGPAPMLRHPDGPLRA
ncbi:hypothetical protein NFI95_14095 [Acetobacteraceae bacterium KSS8]|uniref:Uncharacterized protein n=1 Tax=Endosaccharibacter trunci TaxID=2812733 RepID=A0ABT1WCP0_9PROT|nr:hypothetical protein [Acetobacteraceae bacterium KSS8]